MAKIENLLMGGARGSKIVVTACAQLIAAIAGTTEPYFPEGLSEEGSWTLFKKLDLNKGRSWRIQD